MQKNTLHLVIEIPPEEAWAFAQFLKRAGQSDYQRLAANAGEACEMCSAAEAIRRALSDAGCAPR